MKKTVFKGIINGVEFNDVIAYNEHLTKLIKEGVEVNASSSTHIESKKEEVRPSAAITRQVIDESTLLPYFSNDNDYYLDLLVSDCIEKNDTTRRNLGVELNDKFKVIENYLKTASESDIKKYIDKVLDIINQMNRDMKYNDEAIHKINETREEIERDYNESLNEIKQEYEAEMHACDTEETVINSANDIINDFLVFYKNILNTASSYIKECTCNGTCKECTCNKSVKEDEKIVTETKEKTKQQVKDLNSLFNKIFGIGLDDLSKHLNA